MVVKPLRSLLYDLFYGQEVETKLEVATELGRLYGEELAKKRRIQAELKDLRDLSTVLSRQMLAMRMDRTCMQCGKEGGGGCCSAAFAQETDVAQLLMNMLAGVVVKPRRKGGADCRYLGEKGCIFLFKPMFCLNYNCSKILAGGVEDLGRLESLSGILLQAQQRLENSLLDFFSTKAADPVTWGLAP